MSSFLSWMSFIRVGGAVLAVSIFVFSAFLAYLFEDNLARTAEKQGAWGVLFYIGFAASAIVFAPLTTYPLVPFAARAWGVFPAALFSIIGWVLGACIAYYLAQRFGMPVVKRYVNSEHLKRLNRFLLKERVGVWRLLLLRLLIPADILSYALGLCVKMSWRRYVSTTSIGVTPVAFIFAYGATLPWWVQGIGGLALILFLWRTAIYIRQ